MTCYIRRKRNTNSYIYSKPISSTANETLYLSIDANLLHPKIYMETFYEEPPNHAPITENQFDSIYAKVSKQILANSNQRLLCALKMPRMQKENTLTEEFAFCDVLEEEKE